MQQFRHKTAKQSFKDASDPIWIQLTSHTQENSMLRYASSACRNAMQLLQPILLEEEHWRQAQCCDNGFSTLLDEILVQHTRSFQVVSIIPFAAGSDG